MDLASASHSVAKRFGLLKRPSLVRRSLYGAMAGAAGATTLNLVTFADMTLRGRPASEVPSKVVARLRALAGLDEGPTQGKAGTRTKNQRDAMGALLGIATGVGIGVAFGLLRPSVRSWPVPFVGTIVAAAAMVASDVPATALGVTDPGTWRAPDWAADIVPHLAFGLTTVAVFDALADPYD
jgi:hypothetical protein